jgi:hypothetical protein
MGPAQTVNRLPRLQLNPRRRTNEFRHPSVRSSVRGPLATRVSDVPSTLDGLRVTIGIEPRSRQRPRRTTHSTPPTETLPSGSSDTGETGLLNGRNLTRQDQYPAEKGDDTGCPPLASSGLREGALCRDEGSEGYEPEPDVGGDCNSILQEDCRPAYPPLSEDRSNARMVPCRHKHRRVGQSYHRPQKLILGPVFDARWPHGVGSIIVRYYLLKTAR